MKVDRVKYLLVEQSWQISPEEASLESGELVGYFIWLWIDKLSTWLGMTTGRCLNGERVCVCVFWPNIIK